MVITVGRVSMNRTAYNRDWNRRHAARRNATRNVRKWCRWLVMSACTELAWPEPWRVVDSGRIQPVRRPVLKLRRV